MAGNSKFCWIFSLMKCTGFLPPVCVQFLSIRNFYSFSRGTHAIHLEVQFLEENTATDNQQRRSMDSTAIITNHSICPPVNVTQIHLDLMEISEENLLIHSRSIRSSCDPLTPIAVKVKQFFVWKIFLVFTFLMALLSFAVSLINSVQQNSNNNNNNNK